jgi:hypothetical protein
MPDYVIRKLNSGLDVLVDPSTGKVTFRTCTWLVRVASGHPEPDCFADTFKDVDCGVRLANDQNLCEYHQRQLDAPHDDWHDLERNPATDLSHVC